MDWPIYERLRISRVSTRGGHNRVACSKSRREFQRNSELFEQRLTIVDMIVEEFLFQFDQRVSEILSRREYRRNSEVFDGDSRSNEDR